MKALIDGDILVYKVGFICQQTVYAVVDEYETHSVFEDIKDAMAYKDIAPVDANVKIEVRHHLLEHINYKKVLDSVISRILEDVGTEDYTIYLSHTDLKKNFRYKIYSEYKANRKGMKKPIIYNKIRNYIQQKYQSIVSDGELEADDLLGMHQSNDTIICSIDKDLLQIPGKHYNNDSREVIHSKDPGELILSERVDNKGRYKYILKGFGYKWFWAQMLLGDIADNITGIKRMGPKTVYNYLYYEDSFKGLARLVKQKYIEHDMLDLYHINKRLLWIKRNI